VSPGINPDELLYNFAFALEPIVYGGAVTTSSGTPKLARAPLDFLLDLEVFLRCENRPSTILLGDSSFI